MTNKPVNKRVFMVITVNSYNDLKCSETCPFLFNGGESCDLFKEELEDTKQRCKECIEREIKEDGKANCSI
jgi:hypothetical protein